MEDLPLERHEHRCRIMYAKCMARMRYTYAIPSGLPDLVKFQGMYNETLREARAAFPDEIFPGMDNPMPDLQGVTEEDYGKVFREWRGIPD